MGHEYLGITSFTGRYRWLSNFWTVTVRGTDGRPYRTVEHGYVAAKCMFVTDRIAVQALHTPGAAKRFGRNVRLRPEWAAEGFRLLIMKMLLIQKFADPTLRSELLETGGMPLIEGNTWGDTFWGESPLGTGSNHLGKLIMRIRDDLMRTELLNYTPEALDQDTWTDPYVGDDEWKYYGKGV